MKCDINKLYKVLKAMDKNLYEIFNSFKCNTENHEIYKNQWLAVRQIIALMEDKNYLNQCAEIYEVE